MSETTTEMYLDVFDKGTSYLVNKAFTSNRTKLNFLSDSTYIIITDTDVFSYISEHLIAGDMVQIPKNLPNLTIQDIILNTPDSLELTKMNAEIKIKATVNQRLGNAFFYDYFVYSQLNNQITNAGYVITGDDKDSQYLAILNSGDDVLIGKLQKFLETQTRLGVNNALYEASTTALDNIEAALTEADVTTLLETFLDSLN